MKKLSKVFLRKATFSDIEFLWYLRNQQNVYRYSKKNRPVKWKEHVGWIIPIILGSELKEIFIIEKLKLPIGQIRVDYQTLDIGISILKIFRGKGLANNALGLVIKRIKKQKKAKKLIAEIHKENLSSMALFKKLGFEFKVKEGNWLKYILNLYKND